MCLQTSTTDDLHSVSRPMQKFGMDASQWSVLPLDRLASLVTNDSA
jgi:hypothetical protein